MRLKNIASGIGFDSHIYGPSGILKLGGLAFNNLPALKGHSDGDAVLHAVIDSLLGAAGLGDIGDLFPDSDKRLKGFSSLKMLSAVKSKLNRSKRKINNIDVVVMADKPRLGPKKKRMEQKIARALKIKASQVNVKAKTLEGLNWFSGRGGIAVWSIAQIS